MTDGVDQARLRPHLRQDARAQTHIRRAQHQRHHARAEHQPSPTSVATAAGDPRKLRGIPAIGRSVTGAIAGTQPHQQHERGTR